jgi:hypothetical protein
MTSNKTFHCRLKVFEQSIDELTVFVWELEPLDKQTRSAREWIEEHIRDNYEDLLPQLGIKDHDGWEAVFIATIRSTTSGCLYGEHDESVELIKWQVQALPSEDD